MKEGTTRSKSRLGVGLKHSSLKRPADTLKVDGISTRPSGVLFRGSNLGSFDTGRIASRLDGGCIASGGASVIADVR